MKKTVVIIFMVIAVALTAYGVYVKNKDLIETDAKKFSEEYTKIDEENPFVYRDLKEINKILENGTGLVYLGFPECPWCQQYVVYLNEVAKDYELEKIYYADVLEDRKNNTEDYKKTVELLKDYLQFDDEGNNRIYVPSVIAVYKGNIVGFDDETAWDTKGFEKPEDYWNDENVKALKERLEQMIIDSSSNMCSECNK